ncbi:SCO4225 family membrane protein [Streptomyces sp. NPDC088794]|uniref:SCO4225 family membrane protein n=1 Tax=Streptomyces sp. NPDC088794 TaxID=3365902 RepID=UPI00382F1091
MTGTGTGRSGLPSSRSPSPPPSLLRRLRHYLTDFVALGYLAVCAGLLGWLLFLFLDPDADIGFAPVVPAFATAPASFVWFLLPDSTVLLFVALAFGALVNATVIGWCSRTLRRR